MDPPRPQIDSRGSTAGTRVGLAVLALAALAAAFHLPRLDEPFGIADVNGGGYFGLFARTWEDWGFWELRGVPLGAQRLADPAQGLPYLNHPPGLAWLFFAIGAEEWRMRAVTVVAAALAATSFLLLLRRAVGLGGATLAAATLLGVPSLTVYSQVSYETVVLACGMLLWLASVRVEGATARPRAWRAVQAASAFLGVWADWSFVFFCAGLLPLLARRSWRATARALAAPAAAAASAAVLVSAWRVWAAAGTRIEGSKVDTSLGEMVRTTILARPPLTVWLERATETMLAATTAPLAVLALVGAPFLARAAPRLLAAFAVAGLGQPLVFGNHATDHVHFYCYTSALLAAAAAGPMAAPRRGLRIAGALALGVVGGFAWWSSVRLVEHADTTFYRDLGRVLTEATAHESPGGSPRKAWRVGTNFPLPYPYYVDSPHVVPGRVTDVGVLRALRRNGQLPYGYRYLWFADARGRNARGLRADHQAELAAFLEPFPKTRIPALERRLYEPRRGYELAVEAVWLVQVPPRFAAAVARPPALRQAAAALASDLASGPHPIRFEHATASGPAAAAAACAASPPGATHLLALARSPGDVSRLEPAVRAALDAHLPVVVAGPRRAVRLPDDLAGHRLLATVDVDPAADPATAAGSVVSAFEAIALRADEELPPTLAGR